MSEQKESSLKDFLGKDLAGYRLVEVYFLEYVFDEDCLGKFPALLSDTERVVFCATRDLAERMAKKLPDPIRNHRYRLIQSYAFIDEGKKVVMYVSRSDGLICSEQFHYMDDEKFCSLVQNSDEPFVWYVSLHPEFFPKSQVAGNPFFKCNTA